MRCHQKVSRLVLYSSIVLQHMTTNVRCDLHAPVQQINHIDFTIWKFLFLWSHVCGSLLFCHARRCLSFSFSISAQFCNENSSPGARPWIEVLLQIFQALKAACSTKATGSVEPDVLDSSWRQCTLSPNSPHS